jgi:hypothetical protein
MIDILLLVHGGRSPATTLGQNPGIRQHYCCPWCPNKLKIQGKEIFFHPLTRSKAETAVWHDWTRFRERKTRCSARPTPCWKEKLAFDLNNTTLGRETTVFSQPNTQLEGETLVFLAQHTPGKENHSVFPDQTMKL